MNGHESIVQLLRERIDEIEDMQPATDAVVPLIDVDGEIAYTLSIDDAFELKSPKGDARMFTLNYF